MEKTDKKNVLRKYVDAILIIGSLFVAIGTIFSAIRGITVESLKMISTLLNLAILTAYYIASKEVPELLLKEEKEKKREYCKLLNVKFRDNTYDIAAEKKTKRVNILVKQLHATVTWYALFLIVVYFLYTIDNKLFYETVLHKNYNENGSAHHYFNVVINIFNYLSAVSLFLGFQVLYNKTIADDDETPLPYYRKEVIVSSFLIGIYIFISMFIIPFENSDSLASKAIGNINIAINSFHKDTDKTASDSMRQIKEISAVLENDNSSNSNSVSVMKRDSGNASKSASDSIAEVKRVTTDYDAQTNKQGAKAIGDIKEIITKYENKTDRMTQNLIRLFIGIFNGLAMALLFGRYISMEHSAYNMAEKGEYSNFIHLCTISILPIYALAQPLFGSFEIDVFGNRDVFAIGVFFVCLIGKAVFLYLTYSFMKNKSMHLYLHSIITSHGIPKDLRKCFEEEK